MLSSYGEKEREGGKRERERESYKESESMERLLERTYHTLASLFPVVQL